MTKEDKIKAECDKLTAEFEKLYGDRYIIVGRTKGHTYMGAPDDPKEFGTLVERMLMGLARADKPEHIGEAFKAMLRFKEFVEKQMAN